MFGSLSSFQPIPAEPPKLSEHEARQQQAAIDLAYADYLAYHPGAIHRSPHFDVTEIMYPGIHTRAPGSVWDEAAQRWVAPTDVGR